MNYKYFLIDCGEGTQMQLRKYRFKLQKINHIFISHLHGDHFFGLIGLISTLHLLGRDKELHIYANEQLKEIIDLQLSVSGTELIFPLIFHPTNQNESEIIYEDEQRFVKSFPLNHRVPTTGFLFSEKNRLRKIRKDFLQEVDVPFDEIPKIKAGEDFVDSQGNVHLNKEITTNPLDPRTFGFCSDTSYFEPAIDNIRNINLLYHEATFMQEMAEVAHEKFHSTAAEAATIAYKAGVKGLIIGHFSARYTSLDELLDEARVIFPATRLADDGDEFKIIDANAIIQSSR
jgi:ribonuclease Z